MKPEHRSALLALASRRGQKGFSGVLGEAIESFLQGEVEREKRRKTLLSLGGSLSKEGRRGLTAYGKGTPGELAVILADTDVLIDFLVGVQPVKNQIADYIKAEQLQTTAVTCFELLSGADESKRGRCRSPVA